MRSGQHRPRRCVLVAAVVATVLAASCAAGDDVESIATDPVPGSVQPEESASEPTTPATPTTSTTPTTSAAIATTSTTTPEQGAINTLCETLGQPGLETRRAAVETFRGAVSEGGTAQGDADGLANEACADDWARVNAANSIIERNLVAQAGPLGDGQTVVLDGFVCDVTSGWSVDATNLTLERLGLNLVFYIDVGDERVVTSPEPILISGLEPGTKQTVTAPAPSFRTSEDIECGADGIVFLDDRSEADAGLESATRPELTGDDPAEWFPHLYNASVDQIGSGDTSLSGVIEDVRSDAYGEVEEELLDETARQTGPKPVVAVCVESIREEGDVMVFAYRYVTPAGTETDETGAEVPTEAEDGSATGVFRRGSDGQWRWLGNDRTFKSERYTDCGPGVDLATL